MNFFLGGAIPKLVLDTQKKGPIRYSRQLAPLNRLSSKPSERIRVIIFFELRSWFAMEVESRGIEMAQLCSALPQVYSMEISARVLPCLPPVRSQWKVLPRLAEVGARSADGQLFHSNNSPFPDALILRYVRTMKRQKQPARGLRQIEHFDILAIGCSISQR